MKNQSKGFIEGSCAVSGINAGSLDIPLISLSTVNLPRWENLRTHDLSRYTLVSSAENHQATIP